MTLLDIPRLLDILSIDIWIDKTTKKVFFRQQLLELPNREYDVLECLCIHKGKLVLYDQIASHIWSVEADWEKFSLNAITMAVSRLRKKFKNECGSAEYIETVVGLGYILHQAGFLPEQMPF
jgi:two-component system OmpR family response regulator